MDKIYFYISIACCVLAAVAFGLAFTVLGVYALISSILLGIAALSFSAAQKKKNKLPALLYLNIAAYAVLALAVALFIGGLIYSAV